MSTDPATRRAQVPPSGRRARARRRRRRGFLAGFAVILGVLLLAGAGAGAVGTLQGPRLTGVQFDAQASVAASGSRMILTASQPLQQVDASQVTVTPAAAVTVSTSGRSIGLRFALPLYDQTSYTVTVSGVTGAGGGPAATITQTFTTPALQAYVLRRGADGGDTVYRTGIDGAPPVPVYTASHIEDFRATASYLVMSVRTDAERPALVVTDLQGQGARDLPLPDKGDGTVQELQSADRGDVIGYTYTDPDPSAQGAHASSLFTASLKAADADNPPTSIMAAGAPVSAADWRFVPDSDSILVLSFAGRLLLTPPDGSKVVDLGDATRIEGIARGTSEAVVLRLDGLFRIELKDGTSERLVAVAGIGGYLGGLLPLSDGSTLRQLTAGDGSGSTVYRVGADGAATPVFTASGGESLLQTCASPSGRYAAFVVQPDATHNAYVTGYDLPVPKRIETHVVDIDDGSAVSTLDGFALSWCQVPLQ